MRPSLLAVLLAACAEQAPPPPTPAPATTGVAWIAPAPAERQVVVTLPAQVEPRPDAVVVRGPPVESRIASWKVAPGDAVREGDPLAVLESPRLTGLSAAVAGRRRALDAAHARLEAGVGTVGDVAAAEADLATTAAELASARESVRGGAEGAVWTSPADGVVAELGCARGASAGPDDPCVTLVEPGAVAVHTRVPERHLQRLSEVTARWHGHDGLTLEDLPLASREPAADPTTRTVALRFGVEAPTALVPWTSGRVDLVAPAPPGAWIVPSSALTTLDDRAVVFARSGDEARPVEVTVLGRGPDPDTALVDGAIDGAEVAWRGVFQLKGAALLGEEEAP